MGIVKDLRKEKERLERKVKAAEHLRNTWKQEYEKEKARGDLLEIVLAASVIRNGGILELTMEDIGKTDGKLICGELMDGSDGRIYRYIVQDREK